MRRDLGVNEYLDWEIVRRAKSEGFMKLDMCEPGPSRYKSKFDPVLEPFCFVSKTDALAKILNVAYPKLAGPRGRVKQILRWGQSVNRTVPRCDLLVQKQPAQGLTPHKKPKKGEAM